MSAGCPHGTYGTGCGYCGTAPTPEHIAAERKRLELAQERGRIVARSKMLAELARAHGLADKHGVIG